MARSLTVLLPVRNVQSTLAGMVGDILDVVSELTGRFDLVIIDEGSVDATCEVAADLTRRYPQVLTIHHDEHLGRDAAICSGIEQSSGDIIFVRDETCDPATHDIVRLWFQAGGRQQPLVEPVSQSSSDGKWTRISAGHEIYRAGYRMIDRRAFEAASAESRPNRPNYMTRLKKFTLGE